MELDYPQIWRQTRGDPLVSDEVMYATGPKSVVYALDTRTGEKRWQWDPGIPDERQGGPSICCGDVNRGVAIYGDKVFVGLLDGRLGLDRETGLVDWTVQTTPRNDWDYTATQPLMLLDLPIAGRDRKVIIQAAKNGFFYVVDRLTGELISASAFTDDLTWAIGVDVDTGRPIETPEARYGRTGQGVDLSPGPGGAHN